MALKTWTVSKDILWADNTLTGGADPHLPVGYGGTPTYQYRAGLWAPSSWPADFQQLTKAELVININPGNTHMTQGTRRCRAFLLSKDFAEGSGSDSGWNSSGTPFSSMTTDSVFVDSPVLASSGQVRIDLTDLFDRIVPVGKKRSNGSTQSSALAWRGVLLTAYNGVGGSGTNNVEFVSSEGAPDPYFLFTYVNNRPPRKPQLVTPADGAIVSTADRAATSATPAAAAGTWMTVRGQLNDLDRGSYIKRARVQVFPAGTTDNQANSGAVLPQNDVTWKAPSGTQPSEFAVTVGVQTPGFTDPALTRRSARRFRVQITDNQGADGGWTLLDDGDFTPNAIPVLTNPVVTRNTRTPDFYASISDADSALGGTNGTITAMQYFVWTMTPSGPLLMNPNSSKSDVAGNPTRASLPYSGDDLQWNEEYWAILRVWDDADEVSPDSAKIYFTPRQALGPATMLPNGVETKQNTVTPAFTVGDTNPFDKFTMRFWRDADVLIPFWQQTHTTLAAALAAVPTGTTNVKVSVAGLANLAAIPNVVIGDVIRLTKDDGVSVLDRTVTAVGTTGSAGTGLTFSATVAAAGFAVGGVAPKNTARTIQATRTYAGPTGAPGIDWGATPYWDGAVEPTGAAAYLTPSQRIPFYINADPTAPTPVSVVGGVNSGLGYWAVADTTPDLVFPFVDPDKKKGYTEAPTRREITIERWTGSAWTAHSASPFVITSGITDTYTVATALTPDTLYRARARYDDSANRRSTWSEYLYLHATAAPTLAIVAPPKNMTLATSAAADDIIDTVGTHGFTAGTPVVFPTLTGGAGLTAGTIYYVTATSLGPTTLRVAATPGGANLGFTTDITAGTVESVAADPTTLVDYTFSGSGGKLQEHQRLVLEEITGDPYVLYDSGKLDTAASDITVPPFKDDGETPLLADAQRIRATLQAWDTDQVPSTLTWTWQTDFAVPTSIIDLTLTPDPVGSSVGLIWDVPDAANQVEYRVYRRAVGGEFVRIDGQGAPWSLDSTPITDPSMVDYQANLGVDVDYFVTQHNGALESLVGDESQATTRIEAIFWSTEAPDGSRLRNLLYAGDWREEDQGNDVLLRPLPGDDDSRPNFPIPLSGGDNGKHITLTLTVPPDEADEIEYLRALRRDVRRGTIEYIVLKSPEGLVWRVQLADIPQGAGSSSDIRTVTLTADEIA